MSKRRLLAGISILLSFLLFASIASADVIVKLADGTSHAAQYVKYDGQWLVLPDGRKIDRESIRELIYLKGGTGWQYEPTKFDSSIYTKYFEEAARLSAMYPSYPYYIIRDENKLTVNPDGTRTKEVRAVYWIANESGKGVANTGWGVELERERYIFRSLRSISPDLKVTDVDPSEIEMDQVSEHTSFFNRYQSISVRIPSADVGDLVEIHTIEETYKPPDPKIWNMPNYFRTNIPMSYSNLVIEVPKGRKVFWKTFNMDPKYQEPARTRAKKMDVFTWERRDCAPMISESNPPWTTDHNDMIVISSLDSYQPIFDFARRMVLDKTEPNDDVRHAVEEIILGAKDDDEKVSRIYHYVQKNIRYISIKGGVGSGFGGHPAWFTLKNRYGDCIDKAILMVAMLKCAGVEADVAILMTNGGAQMMEQIPVIWLNHAITKVMLPDRSFYLDSTATSYRYPTFRSDDHGSYAILVKAGRMEKIQPPGPEWNRDILEYDIAMDKDGGFDLTYTRTGVGRAEASLRSSLKDVSDLDLKKRFRNFAKSFAENGELVDYEISGVDDLSRPVVQRISLKVPDYVLRSGNFSYFQFPGIMNYSFPISEPERLYPLRQSSAYSTKRSYRLKLPPGFFVAALPAPFVEENENYDLHVEYKVEGDTLIAEYLFDRKPGIVTPQEYPAFRERLLEAEKYLGQHIFLVEGKGGRR